MITVEHLTKCYGDFLAVDDLSFEIEEGHVYGFLGPNGAGKSTTMNIITGCLSATSGRVRIDGHDIFEEPGAAKRLIGYLPEQPPLYLNETPVEYLRFVGEAKGLRGGALERQIAEVVEQTRLTGVRHRCISALSKGYRQRVGIAQALGLSFWMSPRWGWTPSRSLRSGSSSGSWARPIRFCSAPTSCPRCRPSATRSS